MKSRKNGTSKSRRQGERHVRPVGGFGFPGIAAPFPAPVGRHCVIPAVTSDYIVVSLPVRLQEGGERDPGKVVFDDPVQTFPHVQSAAERGPGTGGRILLQAGDGGERLFRQHQNVGNGVLVRRFGQSIAAALAPQPG